jgi:hypothetical protein
MFVASLLVGLWTEIGLNLDMSIVVSFGLNLDMSIVVSFDITYYMDRAMRNYYTNICIYCKIPVTLTIYFSTGTTIFLRSIPLRIGLASS